MKHALGLKGGPADIAMRIKRGKINEYDLINCNNKKRAFMASIGIDGEVIRLRDEYLGRNITGFRSYFMAILRAYFKEYERTNAEVTMDDTMLKLKGLLNLMVHRISAGNENFDARCHGYQLFHAF